MVDPCGPNVVNGPLSWLSTRPVILEQGFLTTFASRSLGQPKKPRPKLATPAFSGFAKAKRQSVFHRNLDGAWGGIDSRHPVHLRKWLWSQKEPEPFIYLMERATGSPRVCFANPCFAAGHWPLRAALENAHAFSQLRTLLGSIPVARQAYENGSGTKWSQSR